MPEPPHLKMSLLLAKLLLFSSSPEEVPELGSRRRFFPLKVVQPSTEHVAASSLWLRLGMRVLPSAGKQRDGKNVRFKVWVGDGSNASLKILLSLVFYPSLWLLLQGKSSA